MNVTGLHQAACGEFDIRVQKIAVDQWRLPTPCPEWDVRALVNHVTVEDLWTPSLLYGRTLDDVGDRFDGDQLGDDPVGSWRLAVLAALDAVAALRSVEQVVHLSFGDAPAELYLMQMAADHLIHAWDLAVAINADRRLDPWLVQVFLEWFPSQEEAYRSGGAIAERPPLPADADPQTRLLAMFGRVAAV